MIPFPDKKYDIIYADPAWDYGEEPRRIVGGGDFVIPYQMMSTKDLCDMPVQSIAKDDCLLFMWTTGLFLEDSITVGKAWGFQYSTIGFNWDKQRPMLGHYTVIQTELCLVFRKGKKPEELASRTERQFISCKKGGHSVKPMEVKRRIERMFPKSSKIELFARPLPLMKDLDDGWDYWGNEV